MARHTLIRTLYLSISILLLLASCIGGEHGPTEAQLSAFGEYVYRIDTARLEQRMTELMSTDSDIWEADRELLKRYKATNLQDGRFVWFTRMGVSDEADLLLTHLRRELPRAGLDTSAFMVPEIASRLQVVRELAFDSLGLDINDVLTALEWDLSRAFVRYTVGQHYGFVRPEQLLNRLDRTTDDKGFLRLYDEKTKLPDYEEAIRRLADEQRLEYLNEVLPDDPTYRILQERLVQTTDPKERHTLAVNMERRRWHTERPPRNGRMVLVNIPAQQLWAVSPDSVLDMRICCGSTATKTPLLHSAINYIQVNPDWIITPNIVKNEVARHAGDSVYFARHRYYITNRERGDTLNPARVSAAELTSGRLRVGQHGGAGNSLGRLIFRFPNDFSVYLHDTSNRSAFDRERRTLSHGCIRVQKPFELAMFVLPEMDEWTVDRLRLSMDLPPLTDQGREYLEEHPYAPRPLRLLNYHRVEPTVPVFIIYETASPNPATGHIDFWPDLYGYDEVLSRHAPFI